MCFSAMQKDKKKMAQTIVRAEEANRKLCKLKRKKIK